MTTQNITTLIEVSRQYGKYKSFVIAGGGNTSYKDATHIWIKASGAALETIDENGFVCLSREKLKIVSTKTYAQDATQREAEVKADLTNAIVSSGNNRPSVETSMHEIIDYPFVVHTHPTRVNAVMCANNAKKTCTDLFGDQALFIPYTDPGYILFKKVLTEIANYTSKHAKAPQIIFLENHGIFVAGETTDEINGLYSTIMEKIDHQIKGDQLNASQQDLKSVLIDQVQNLHPGFKDFVAIGKSSQLISHFVKDSTSFQKANTAFTPDDIVYCKAYYLFLPACSTDLELVTSAKERIDAYYKNYGYLPKVLALEGKGIIGVEENTKSTLNVLEVYSNILLISQLTENFGGPKFMNKEQIEFIDNWEVENYRRKMAKS